MTGTKNNRYILRQRAAFQRFAERFWGVPSGAGTLPIELLGVDEIAQMSGYTKNYCYLVMNRADAPAPVARVGTKLLWAKVEIIAWAKSRKRARRIVHNRRARSRPGDSDPDGAARPLGNGGRAAEFATQNRGRVA